MRRHQNPTRPDRAGRFYPAAKRLFDFTFACGALLLAAPVMLILVLGVWLGSPGPVFFRQRRVGRGGKLFTIYKFRTMHAGASPYAESPADDGDDSRVTSWGRILRKTGLDELPQFFNVLRGEMSVVGPRPEMPFLVSRHNRKQRRRLDVLPGVTGLWQISPARSEPIHENLRYDYYYLRHRSLGLDLQIIGGTLLVMLRGLVSGITGPKSAEAGRVEEPAALPAATALAGRAGGRSYEAVVDQAGAPEANPAMLGVDYSTPEPVMGVGAGDGNG